MLDAAEVAKLLAEIGQRMELGGESPFKTRAYQNAADSLIALSQPLAEIIAKGKLREIPGVGEAIAEKIIKLHKTGTHPTLEFLREQMPAGVLELMKVPGLGPKKVLLLYTELNITSLAELEDACRENKLDGCKGLGAKLAAKILQGIEFIHKGSGQRLIDAAGEHLALAIKSLKASNPQLEKVTPAGDFRLGREVVLNHCLVVQSPEQISVMPTDVSIVTSDQGHLGAALLFATGSSEHLQKLSALASAKGLSLSEKGLFRDSSVLAAAEERDIYSALGLPFIEPELREGNDEIELGLARGLPNLVNDSDVRGILHSHTDFSDGATTLENMAEAVRKRGYQYYGVADHSQSAAYAGGMKEDRVREQQRLADKLNAGYEGKGFRIFKGIESDILEDGSLDYSDLVLRDFDFVVASVHSRFGLDKDKQTARLLAAVANPNTTILGHMTGRLLLKREGYALDIDAVLKACASHRVAVEINAHPQRLDLDWRWHRRALELGCMLSINPDAHSIGEIDLVHWGVVIARKGGVPSSRVLNCLSLEEITRYFAEKKHLK